MKRYVYVKENFEVRQETMTYRNDSRSTFCITRLHVSLLMDEWMTCIENTIPDGNAIKLTVVVIGSRGRSPCRCLFNDICLANHEYCCMSLKQYYITTISIKVVHPKT